MESQKSNVQNIFSTIAEKYDFLNTLLSLNIDSFWRNKAIKISNINKNDKVLDLCCGTGKMMNYICKKVGKDTEVIGFDLNQDMLNVAFKNLNKSIKDYNYKLLNGDVQVLPFNNCSFDCVTIAFGLRNVPNKMKALSEIYRVLRPGGKAVCLELSTPQLPVFKQLYGLYFNYILPIIGYLGTGSKNGYYYLRDSVNNFMSKPELKHAFEVTGFKDVAYKSLTGGVASVHFGTKV